VHIEKEQVFLNNFYAGHLPSLLQDQKLEPHCTYQVKVGSCELEEKITWGGERGPLGTKAEDGFDRHSQEGSTRPTVNQAQFGQQQRSKVDQAA